MGVLDQLTCCIRKSNTTKNRTKVQNNPETTSTDQPDTALSNCKDTVKEARQNQSKRTETEREETTSLHDVTVTTAINKAVPEITDISRSSSGASTEERMSRNVNVVHPRVTKSSQEHRISLPEDIEEKYDPYHYTQMMTKTYTNMSSAYNREATGLGHGDNLSSSRTTGYGQTMTDRDSESGTKVYSLLQASCRGDQAALQKLCQEGMDMGAADYDGRRALHLSAAEGHLDCVKFLLEKCNVPHSPRDRWYHTPLDEAKTFKRDAVVKYMDELIRTEEEKEKGAKTYLLLNSACSGDIRTLKRLYQEGVDMKLADYDGRTCLHLAASEGHLDCLKFLLEQCEVPHSPKDRWFNTPLNEAKGAKHTNCIEFLEDFIHQYDARKEGVSVYSILSSASKGDTRTLEKLAREGEDMMAADYDGRTALHLAASEGHMGVVTFLMEKCKVDPNPKDRWQHTPLDEAKNSKNDTIVKYLERNISNKTKIIADNKPK